MRLLLRWLKLYLVTLTTLALLLAAVVVLAVLILTHLANS